MSNIPSNDAAQPVACITRIDEYGPCIDWHTHWADLGSGTKLYTATDYRRAVANAESWKILAERMRVRAEAAEARVEAMSDYRTHHHDWRRACIIAAAYANDQADVDYWHHQVRALDALNAQGESNG